MKRKMYQQPVIEVVAAAPTEMIAASLLNEGEVDVIGIIDDDQQIISRKFCAFGFFLYLCGRFSSRLCIRKQY